jgi:carbonic anhydrase
MASYEQIFENNKQWVADNVAKDVDFLEKLASDQHPEYLYIGCSDSRVPANEIMGLAPGEVFVHRNIANLVPSIDLNVMSVINYAVAHLHVKHIVVCGHYNCGGVKAAMTPKDLGILNPWLRNIRDVYRLHEKELDEVTDEHEKYNRLIELNVEEQCRNVIKTAVVQQSYVQNKFPVVHGWVFDLQTGLLKDLKVDFDAILKDIQKIYDLTGA